MRYPRIMMVFGALATSVAVACSDSGTTKPDATPASFGTSGSTAGTDTAKSNPTTPATPKPDSGKTTKPDSGKTPTPTPAPKSDTVTVSPDTAGQTPPSASTTKHVVGGIVMGLGVTPDTAHGELLGGATVVLSMPADQTTATPGLELARATSAADGSFSFGSFLPGRYVITVTPPAGAPYKSVQYSFLFYTSSPANVSLTVWLQRQ